MRIGRLNKPVEPDQDPASAVSGASAPFDTMTIKVSARAFDEIASGVRRRVHLPTTRHWTRQLLGKDHKTLVLNRSHLTSAQIAIPWPGYSVELIRSAPTTLEVAVYVLDVSGAAFKRPREG